MNSVYFAFVLNPDTQFNDANFVKLTLNRIKGLMTPIY